MVQEYLAASKLQVERQVMLEAKIISVTLNDAYQTGINWSAFKNSLANRLSGGTLSPGAQLSPSGTISASGITVNPGTSISALDTLSGGLFGLAFQTANFAAVLNFLESQGGVQVLSSPRIATLNNQQAVLKVGTDDFFVTNISTTTSSVGSTSTTSPSITVQPFFSGIALDVTPEISDTGEIILHIHPQVSVVSERNKVLNLGSLGTFTLPLASSNINESDSVVRVSDGRIFAIGGLMSQQQSNDHSGLPGTGGTILGNIFGQTNRSATKQELVILLKPTVVNAAADTDATRTDALEHLLNWFEQKPAS
jgi:MSHA biogenesis protein MshL